MDEKTIQKLNTGISAVFIVAAAILFGVALKNRKVEPATAVPQEQSASPTQAYDDLSGMQRAVLAEGAASWTPQAKLEPEKTRTATVQTAGAIGKAYLVVKASLEGKPLTKYESIYVKLNDVGGHLFRPESLPTPESGMTSLLFDLSDVPVLPSVPYDETRTPQSADLAATLQDGKSVRLTAFISSMRPALLEELSIAYVCAEGSDCSLTVK